MSKHDDTIRAIARGFRKDFTSRYLYEVFSGIGSPLALRAKSMLLRSDWKGLMDLSVDPRDYSNYVLFPRDYLVCELPSKVPPGLTGVTSEELAAKALDKFRESEITCMHTNRRLPLVDSTMFRNLYGHDVREVFCLARDKIHQLLGDLNLREVSTGFGFGPGATTRLNRSKADLYYKMGPEPHTTYHNLALAEAAVGLSSNGDSDNLWASLLSEAVLTGTGQAAMKVVPGSKVTTVPKNSKTDRTIAVEPCLNMFVQKGIGSAIRRRLKQVGINLDDQSINQNLARDGSVDGSLATIDLSSASDSVSRRIVEILLPDDWFRFMEMCRSHDAVLPSGEVVPFHKFSSMGNGFTFELETLIFWALSKSAVQYQRLRDHRVGVYGDDIIVPTAAVQLVTNVLTVAGFTLNSKKTFVDGPFRESCGKHYFLGHDVTPFYLRKEMTHAQPLFLAVNNYRRWLSRVHGFSCPVVDWRLYKRLFALVPRSLRRFRGPDGYGDSFLIGNFEEVLPQRAVHGLEGWQVKILRLVDSFPTRKTERVEGPQLLVKSFYRLQKSMLEEGVASDVLISRRKAPFYKISRMLVVRFPLLTIMEY